VAAGASGSVEVTVQINPEAQGELRNVVVLDYEDLIGNPYPDERAEDVTQVTQTAPQITLTKTADLVVDNNNDNRAGPGDVIGYTIVAANSGTGAAPNLVIHDAPDPNTTLRTGTVQIAPTGVIEQGNTAGDVVVVARVAALGPGAAVTLSFEVQVRAVVPNTVTVISNQAVGSADNVPQRPSDDPRTPAPDDPTDVPFEPIPTAVELLTFTATRAADGVLVSWETGVELGTQAFMVYRAAEPVWDNAVPVTEQPIAARGGAGFGASYSWSDTTAHPEVAYSYWLVEITTGDGQHIYGPVSVGAGLPQNLTTVFLPLMNR
jgi:uncharacterized repeat protein (TIGR01451 family)